MGFFVYRPTKAFCLIFEKQQSYDKEDRGDDTAEHLVYGTPAATVRHQGHKKTLTRDTHTLCGHICGHLVVPNKY